MKKRHLKRLLLLIPLVVLIAMLLFLNYTVQYFRDTAYRFVYDTNVQSVQSFSNELRSLSAQGYTSREYGVLFTNMIMNFNQSMGEKEAIVTFLLDEEGEIHHSTEPNREYLSDMLQNGENRRLIGEAFDTRSEGEITPERGGKRELVYYHHFYSGDIDYTHFLCVEKQAIELQLRASGVIIPISVIGLLLLFAVEYAVWLKMMSAAPVANGVPDDAD
ncbi:MAG: hypothetical protein LBR76_01285 [Oscillospiraceae bacterium]|jgi:hypothetical protein|nr:hypothetical protein [Oscillospiraceae bacterium]